MMISVVVGRSSRTAFSVAVVRLTLRWPFLPPYSPDFNPIEMAYAKLKALLKRPPPEPSTTSTTPSQPPSTQSPKPSTKTTSLPQDMTVCDQKML